MSKDQPEAPPPAGGSGTGTKAKRRRRTKAQAAREAELRRVLEIHLAVSGLSRRELDRRLGLSPGSVSRTLRDKEKLSDERFEQLAVILGIPPDELEILKKSKLPYPVSRKYRLPRRSEPRRPVEPVGPPPGLSADSTAEDIIRFLEEKYPAALHELMGGPPEPRPLLPPDEDDKPGDGPP